MIDEIFKVMKCFDDSFINSSGEVIISVKGKYDVRFSCIPPV